VRDYPLYKRNFNYGSLSGADDKFCALGVSRARPHGVAPGRATLAAARSSPRVEKVASEQFRPSMWLDGP
jgi:hypothetical protein